MKTIKYILPILAFLFAVVASLATVNAKAKENLAIIDVSPMSVCVNIGQCEEVTGGDICTAPSDHPVYPNAQLRKWNSANNCGTTVRGNWEEDD